jgi:cellulose synthase/poly-beta-1,6-N-acetylglucosamine synthase-like glycosyltransferase
MISAIITAYKEPRTIGAAIEALLEQDWPNEYEILVVSPDEATREAVEPYLHRYPQVHHFTDQVKGKPAALNLVFAYARGELCVLTDGDVRVCTGALRPLLAPLADERCGAVSGRPISASPRSTLLGYWSHLLTDAGAHMARTRRARQESYFDCSGYLYVVRRSLLPTLPAGALADDAFISQAVWEQNYMIAYAPAAHVEVRYPTTYADWLLQKVRSTAGAADLSAQRTYQTNTGNKKPPARMRSFRNEVREGIGPLLHYPRSLKEWCWTGLLVGARLHLWWRVWLETRVKRRSYHEIWRRVESTK